VADVYHTHSHNELVHFTHSIFLYDR